MNRKQDAATLVAGSIVCAAMAVLVAGCSGGSSGGGGGSNTGTVTPEITAQPTQEIQSSVTPGTPRTVMLKFSAKSPNGAALTASVNQVGGSPSVNITGLNQPTEVTNGDGSVTFNFVGEFEKPAAGGTFRFSATITSASGGSITTNVIEITFGENPSVQQTLNGSNSTSVSITTGGSVTFDFNGTTDDQSLVSAVLDPGDGGGTINLDLADPKTTVTYNSSGTYTAKVTFTDSDGDVTEVNYTITVTNPQPPPAPGLEFNGVAEHGVETPANQTTVNVSTYVHNEFVLVRGVRLTNYPATQLKVEIEFPAPTGKVVVPVISRADIGLGFFAPMRTATGLHSLRLFAHAAGDVNNELEDATLGSPAPMINYRTAPNDNTIVFSGEDSVTGVGGNDGSLVGFDINAAGNSLNVRQILGGNGHVWNANGNFASVNDGETIYCLGNSGFDVKLFKVDASFGGIAPVTTDVETYPDTNQSPSLMTTSENGRPVFLTSEPGVANNFRLWVVKSDLSAADTLVHFNVAGQRLPTGTPIVGLYTMVTDGVEYAIVVAGGTVNNVYKVRLDNNSYTVIDVGDNAFSPEASSFYADTTFGGYRLDMAGQNTAGAGTAYRAIAFETGKVFDKSNPVIVGGSTNAVTGLVGYLDGTSHRVATIRQGENFFSVRNPDANYASISAPTLGTGHLTRELIEARGLGGFVVGHEGTSGAQARFVPFDGGAVTNLTLPVANYHTISVGRQSFAIESRSPFHGALYHHRPSNTTVTVPVTINLRNGGGAAKIGIATP